MLTGKERYRRSLFGKMIFQVEEEYSTIVDWTTTLKSAKVKRWRDATIADVTEGTIVEKNDG